MKTLFLMLCLGLPLHAQNSVKSELLEGKLQTIVFPAIELKDTGFEEAFDSIQRASVEVDGDPDVTKRGVSLVIVPEAGPNAKTDGSEKPSAKVSYSGKEVSLEIVLREVAKVTTRDVFLTSVGIVIIPKGLPAFPNPKAEKGEIFRKLTPDGAD